VDGPIWPCFWAEKKRSFLVYRLGLGEEGRSAAHERQEGREVLESELGFDMSLTELGVLEETGLRSLDRTRSSPTGKEKDSGAKQRDGCPTRKVAIRRGATINTTVFELDQRRESLLSQGGVPVDKISRPWSEKAILP